MIGTLHRAAGALLALLMTVAMCMATVRPALADDNAGDGGASDGVTIAMTAAPPVVTASSGYHFKATITNHADSAVAAGTLTLSTNVFHIFVSRTDMQDWAQGQANIPVPNQLGTATVPALQPGASANVSIDVAADQDALKSIVTWGPKPLLIDYASNGGANGGNDGPSGTDGTGTHEQSHTFLTRSNDGLAGANTPAMSLTVAMPLTSDKWQIDDTAMNALLDNKLDSKEGSAADIVSLGESAQLKEAQEQLIAKHGDLQVIADPLALDALDSDVPVSGIMQPADFDITTYAATDNASAYTATGVTAQDWNADASQRLYRSAVGDDNAQPAVYAWQGNGTWTMQSLTEARRQGYTTVIADHEFDESDNSTVHTGNLVVSTDAGDITVLAQQKELAQLAQGTPTSDTADSENSDAGRLSRFIAQSAFYQMEQPYTARNLLVCLSADNTTANDALMNALEQAPWLELTSLDTLQQADAYATGDDAQQLVHDKDALDDGENASLNQTLSALSGARGDISRFSENVMAADQGASAQAKTGDAAEGTGNGTGNGDGSGSTGGTDTNAGAASGDAAGSGAANGSEAAQAKAWIASLLDVQHTIALHALGSDAQVSSRMTNGATTLASRLMGSVTITRIESITVMSETAKMPVTISNASPFPVHVRVSSITDSMEIVTSRFTDVEVPPRSEAQVTFTIRVSTSGSTNATVTLQDRGGIPFGAPQITAITSVLQISDMSGFVIIGSAVVLGLLGLWRQFHRKKDPDE